MSEFKLPDVGEGIESGTVVAVLVAVGDRIEQDDSVLELETDKAVVEVPATVAGTVREVHVAEGDEVAIGAVVLTVDEGDDAGDDAGQEDAEPEPEEAAAASDEAADDEAADDESKKTESADDDAADDEPADDDAADDEEAASDEPERKAAPKATSAPSGTSAPAGTVPAAPSVRRLARELDVDLTAVQGSGILGRISAEDVRAFAEGDTPRARGAAQAPAAAPLPDFSKFGDTERVAMTGIRKATVKAMANAWATVPMVTHFDKADLERFEELRKRHAPTVEAAGAKLTPTAMLIQIAAAALKRFPDFNASIDVEAQEIVYKHYVNIGVAVDTDHGLLVPVLRDAERKNLVELSLELTELAEKARDRKLSPAEMQGGNFSVSNLGGIGGSGFTPIVNPPDVAILGVSRGGIEPVWDAERETFVPRKTLPLSLTYDHRLIDGAAAARFLRWVCRAVEDPFLLSVEG